MAERFKTTVAVFVGLRDRKGEILLQQRANTGFMDGFWDFSASGHLEAGESIRECAIRELKEEIGVDADEDDLKLVHINQNKFDLPYLNFTFMLDKWQGEPKICEPDKCSGLRYFATDNLPDKCTVNVRVNQHDNFSDDMLYSYVDKDNYEEMVGQKFEDI
jgi:8-oxo-dGTP diphosphatase